MGVEARLPGATHRCISSLNKGILAPGSFVKGQIGNSVQTGNNAARVSGHAGQLQGRAKVHQILGDRIRRPDS